MKLYCVDSFDARVVVERDVPLEERARRHQLYESWILNLVVPFIRDDCGGAGELITCGAASAPFTPPISRSSAPTSSRSRSAYRAATTHHAWHGWGERGDATYFNNPMDYVAHLEGDHLDWLRVSSACCSSAGRANGRTRPARWCPPRGSPRCCDSKGLRCELDLWGYDVAHDWPSWRAQLAHHLPRFC